MTAILVSILLGYLLGSVPFGLFGGRLKGIDVREHGSKNIGATNVWRTCGWKIGLPVFLLDAGKGIAAVLVGVWCAHQWGLQEVEILAFGQSMIRTLAPNPEILAWSQICAATACVLGHSFPVWLKFKGGKGVATSLGAIIAMMPIVSAIIFGLWALIFGLSRYVSLASILAAAAFPVTAFCFGHRGPFLGFAIALGVLVIVRHRGNIQRLRAGTERRAGQKKEAAQ